MAISYVKIPLDYLDALEPYGDAERGRLFTALLTYAKLGEVPQLCGNERFIFPLMRAQVDRDVGELNAAREAKAEAGRKGGLAKSSKLSNAKQSQAQLSTAKQCQEREREEAPSPFLPPSPSSPITPLSLSPYNPPSPEEKESPPLGPPAVPEGVQEVFQEWLTYKRERRESYKPMGLKALEAQVSNGCAAYGARAVREIIRESMANGWKGIAWERLKARKNVIPLGNETTNPFLQMLREEEAKNGQN